MLFIFGNLFWIGLGCVVLTLLFSRPYLRPAKYKPELARNVNRAYIFSFFVMIYGWGLLSMNFGFNNSWYETIGYGFIALLISGAWLENRRDYPLLNREMLNALKSLKSRDEESYLNFYIAVEETGLASAFQKYQSLFVNENKHIELEADLDLDLNFARQAIQFAKDKDFGEVLRSKVPEPYKTIAFQYLAERQLKVCADGILIADGMDLDIEQPLLDFFDELDADSQYEIFPLIADDSKCIEFYYSGRRELQQNVNTLIKNKIGAWKFNNLGTEYMNNYPSSKEISVAHQLLI